MTVNPTSETLGPNHMSVALSLNNLGGLYRKWGRLGEAVEVASHEGVLDQPAQTIVVGRIGEPDGVDNRSLAPAVVTPTRVLRAARARASDRLRRLLPPDVSPVARALVLDPRLARQRPRLPTRAVG